MSMADRERLDEAFTYVQSVKDIIDTNIDTTTGYLPNLARLSRDPVLNAIAQLGPCRLNCQRAFVSLIDDQHQYVIAEVSRSISLFNADIHAPNHGLAIGVRALDLSSGVCAGSIPAFTDPSGAHHVKTENMVSDMTKFVVRDFSVEPQYQSRPYVIGFPWMRFHAGVPIRSRFGHVIGVYAVVDNKPRLGLSDEDHQILVEISYTIMGHLELLQTQSSRDSAFNALKGIKSFVQDSATLASATAESRSRKISTKKVTSNTTQAALAGHCPPSGHAETDTAVSSGKDLHIEPGGGSMFRLRTENSHRTSPPPLSPSASPTTSIPRKGTNFKQSTTEPSQADIVQVAGVETQPNQYKMLLAQAAVRVQEAMRMDEVLFITAPTIRRTGEEHMLFRQPSIVSGLDRRRYSEGEAFEAVLDQLLSRYPGGSYFNFATKTSQANIEARSNRSDCLGPIDPAMRSDLTAESPDSDSVENLDATLLTALPLAKSIMWLPLFNVEHKDCPWAMIAWSSDSRRKLTEEDFSYLALFGVAVQADFARTKSANQNRAKSDVISSISHELRSPLHGILGNAELLLESDMTEEQQQMILMVDKCARSLLATMEHILLHSKVNHNSTKGSLRSVDESRQPELVDLSVLVEHSVDTIMSGSAFRSLMATSISPQAQKSRSPIYGRSRKALDIRSGLSINLRIDHSQSWLVFTEAAVWSRCLMNVLGNALKYTESGSIEVSLEMKEHVDSAHAENNLREVKLSITDTGRGMSPDYLREHLYQPFLQENNTSDGLGLGLSIVKTLINSVDGSVTVQSKLGEGTTVDIIVLVRVEQVKSVDSSRTLLHAGRKIALVNDEPNVNLASLELIEARSSQDGNHKAKLALIEYCTKWHQTDVSCGRVNDDPQAEVLVMFEKSLQRLQHDDPASGMLNRLLSKQALVVIPDIYITRTVSAFSSDHGLFYLIPPFGPQKVALVLEQAFNHADKIKDGTVTQAPFQHKDVLVSVAGNHDQTVSLSSIPAEGAKREKISLNTKVGFGTTITDQDRISRPDEERQKLAETSIKPYIASPIHISGQPTTPGDPVKRVLIVDDNEVNLQFLGRCLKRWNIEYQTACNGAIAVRTFQQTDPIFDCVLMDISMPVMNGLEATRAIRAWEDARKCKVRSQIYALTGLSDDETREDALASGMDKFVTKPFNMKDIGILLNVN